MKCFYHSADLDGKCSGAIVKLAFPDCALIGIDYGDSFPWHEIASSEPVYVVDFTIQPYEDMRQLAEMCGGLHWIDHHKTSLDWADANPDFRPFGIRSLELAGCELTWNYLHPSEEMPEAVHLLGRYDIWKWQSIPRAMPFQMGMRLEDLEANDIHKWLTIFSEPAEVDRIVEQGQIVLRYQQQGHAGVCAYAAHELDWEGLHWIAMNGPYRSSQVFDSVYDPAKHDGMLIYCWNGKQWRFGVYATKPDIDVSAIAKKYGGGGHKGAAGFQTDAIPFSLKGT